MAWADITQKEKDLQQLAQIAEFLFEKNDELNHKVQESHSSLEELQARSQDTDSLVQSTQSELAEKSRRLEILMQQNEQIEERNRQYQTQVTEMI